MSTEISDEIILGQQHDGRITLADDAPDVNLHALILENYGLQIMEHHPTMGRVVIATEDLDESFLYRPILRELPALICKQQDYLDFMEQFLDTPEELQVGILDMFYQPLDSEMGKSLIEAARALYLLGAIDDFTVIHQLLSIYMTNGHSYRGTHTAIPLFGSKFAHSCDPNIGYSSMASDSDGALEYSLLRPIREGEIVCFSYLADLLEMPTTERRKLLEETKSFRCVCPRCSGPDDCRWISCPYCQDCVPCRYYDDESDEAYWLCPECGLIDSDTMMSLEYELETTIESLNRKIERRKDFRSIDYEVTPTLLREVIDQCETKLSQTHYLTIKGLRLLLTQTTAHAFVHIRKRIGRGLPTGSPQVYSLLRQGVDAGIQIVLSGECIAAGCSGCQIVANYEDGIGWNGLRPWPVHEPNYDRALVWRHVCDNLMRFPIFWWPPTALLMVQRYVPLMRARFGSSTTAAVEEHAFHLLNTLRCYECQTYWDGFRCTTTPPTKEDDTTIAEIPAPRSQAKTDKKKKKTKGKKKR